MTRRSKKLRDRSVCPKRRGGKRIKVISHTTGFVPRIIENAVKNEKTVFIGKI